MYLVFCVALFSKGITWDESVTSSYYWSSWSTVGERGFRALGSLNCLRSWVLVGFLIQLGGFDFNMSSVIQSTLRINHMELTAVQVQWWLCTGVPQRTLLVHLNITTELIYIIQTKPCVCLSPVKHSIMFSVNQGLAPATHTHIHSTPGWRCLKTVVATFHCSRLLQISKYQLL